MNKKVAPILPIYLDNAAATPMDERVVAAMTSCLTVGSPFGNSASKDHIYGWQAAEVVEQARGEIAECVGCSPLDLIFTSGATESNNLALRGLAYAARAQALKEGKTPKLHIITTVIEHKAVLENCARLETEGFNVTYLVPRADGTVTPEMLEAALRPDTLLVSISHANSVLGSMNDLASLAQIAAKYGAYFHSDCAQSNGLCALDLAKTEVTLATLTPEKIYGPKGVGALYIKRLPGLTLEPLIVGGGHEKGLRGGTVATHQVAAMGKAFAILDKERPEVVAKLTSMRDELLGLFATMAGAQINGYLDPQDFSSTPHLPGIVSVSFPGISGRLLMHSLTKVACSLGSACSSQQNKPSYVLTALGMDDELAGATLRLSVGRFNNPDDISTAFYNIKANVDLLKQTNRLS